MAAEDIFGLNVGSLKGKPTWTKSTSVRSVPFSLPPEIIEQYREITLSGDIMKANNVPFLEQYQGTLCPDQINT